MLTVRISNPACSSHVDGQEIMPWAAFSKYFICLDADTNVIWYKNQTGLVP